MAKSRIWKFKAYWKLLLVIFSLLLMGVVGNANRVVQETFTCLGTSKYLREERGGFWRLLQKTKRLTLGQFDDNTLNITKYTNAATVHNFISYRLSPCSSLSIKINQIQFLMDLSKVPPMSEHSLHTSVGLSCAWIWSGTVTHWEHIVQVDLLIESSKLQAKYLQLNDGQKHETNEALLN